MAKVLLVEDDNNLREIYEARLTAEGYEIITAQNGEEALSAAKQNKPDLVISDVMMPRISGFEMLDILRNTDELKHTKVIMLTALGQSEDRSRADNLGADKYLVKSQVTLEDIVNSAKELLSDEPTPVATPSAPQAVVTPAESAPVEPSPVAETPAPAPEPVVAAPVITPTEPVAAPADAPAPVATPQPVVDTPVATPVAPAVATVPAPTPVLTTQSDPVAPAATQAAVAPQPSSVVAPSIVPASTTVTVADPDPIAQPVSAPVEPEAAPAVETPAPIAATPEAPAEPNPVVAEPVAPAPEVVTSPAEPQSLADEEAAIEAQIASFAASDAPQQPTPEAPPAQDGAPTNNDAVLDDAISKLTNTPVPAVAENVTSPSETAPTVPEQPAAIPDAQPTADAAAQGSRKVIQPLSDVESGAPNLDELLAKEEAKEVAQTAAASQQATPTDAPAKPLVDPNSIAL